MEETKRVVNPLAFSCEKVTIISPSEEGKKLRHRSTIVINGKRFKLGHKVRFQFPFRDAIHRGIVLLHTDIHEVVD